MMDFTGLLSFASRMITKLAPCSFNSDHQVDLRIIEKVYRRHAKRIEACGSSRYFWRSVCQYECQLFARARLAVLAVNAAAFLCLPFLLVLVRGKKERRGKKIPCEYLKIDFHMAYQAPPTIKDRTVEKQSSRRYLTLADLFWAVGLFLRSGAFYPELLFKFLLWIASARPALDAYDPRYLIQYCEYSAYSSLRKLFLNRESILLANVSHGPEFLSCRSAFSSFDQYFAWDVTPKNLHNAMHIEYADRASFNPCAGLAPAPAVAIPTLGFLWPAMDIVDLDVLIKRLNAINQYCKVLVRPHPNPGYTNHFESYRHSLNAEVSDAHGENIHSFIDRCSVVVGNYSSALIQAASRGREVVYLEDAYLRSLRTYHDYYQTVESIPLESLESFAAAKFNSGVSSQCEDAAPLQDIDELSGMLQ
jgi:hypothetical protein